MKTAGSAVLKGLALTKDKGLNITYELKIE